MSDLTANYHQLWLCTLWECAIRISKTQYTKINSTQLQLQFSRIQKKMNQNTVNFSILKEEYYNVPVYSGYKVF